MRTPFPEARLVHGHRHALTKLPGKLMKGLPHPTGSQQAFLTGLAHLYNLVPYQCRAQHAGRYGVEVEGGKVPTRDWLLNLQILPSGGFR